ncbi:MAG: hypothetical protein WA790_02940 [Sulfitobacter sp.]
MSAIDEILRKRGHEPQRKQTGTYQAFHDSGGHPQMGFTLSKKNGSVDAFFFHNLDNLDLRIIKGAEYLNFTHRGKAVTLQGTHLEPVVRAMMAHSLISLHEYAGGGTDLTADTTVITQVAVTLVSHDQTNAAEAFEDMKGEMHPN